MYILNVNKIDSDCNIQFDWLKKLDILFIDLFCLRHNKIDVINVSIRLMLHINIGYFNAILNVN